MADSKFSALAAIGAIDRANDRLPIIDASEADATKPKNATPKDLTKGKQTIFVPAAAMRPTVTDPAGDVTVVETTTNKVNLPVVGFSGTGTVVNHLTFPVAFPKSWDLGTVTFRVFWMVNASVATVVKWQLKAVTIGDNVTLETAFGTAAAATDTAQSGAREVYVSPVSGTLTIGNTPALDEITIFDFFRDAGDAADTMTQEAELIGVQVIYNTTDGVDD